MPNSLQIALVNRAGQTTIFGNGDGQVYAYITGLALQNNSARFLLQSDGQTPYFPSSPPSVGSPLGADCAIPLGPPGQTREITIPQIAGGRIYFSQSKKLTFFLNPGPALVEPSVTNPSDPNFDVNWSFCEFTLNNDQLYANISYVDFIPALPIALRLDSTTGPAQVVAGMAPHGLDQVCQGLVAQKNADNYGWDQLIVKSKADPTKNLRALSPNQGMVMNRQLFHGYFEQYVRTTWQSLSRSGLSIDTQNGSLGVRTGTIVGDQIDFDRQAFNQPSTEDILSCNTGPFTTGADGERNAIIPRLAAAFNRTTAAMGKPEPRPADEYYKQSPTNHYARLCHEANVDGLGYAFPYDDVTPSGGMDQSGKVNDGNPTLWTITVGGGQNAGDGKGAQREHDELRRDVPAAPAEGPAAGGTGEMRGGKHGSHLDGFKHFLHHE